MKLHFSFCHFLKLTMLQGAHVDLLRSTDNPWQITVTLEGGTSTSGKPAKLQGKTTIPFINGWANFTDLAISLAGTGYKLRFTVSTENS